jgi:hypothetical protein
VPPVAEQPLALAGETRVFFLDGETETRVWGGERDGDDGRGSEEGLLGGWVGLGGSLGRLRSGSRLGQVPTPKVKQASLGRNLGSFYKKMTTNTSIFERTHGILLIQKPSNKIVRVMFWLQSSNETPRGETRRYLVLL